MEMDVLFSEWEVYDERISRVDLEIAGHVRRSAPDERFGLTEILMMTPEVRA